MKITGDTTCPTCKKDHEASFDIDKLEVKNTVPALTNVSTTGIDQILEPPKVETKIVTKIPSYIPKYKCKDCNENHKNKDYTQKPKFKCDKCGQFSPDGQTCLWCDNKEFEELSDEDMEDLGIAEPLEHEHE